MKILHRLTGWLALAFATLSPAYAQSWTLVPVDPAFSTIDILSSADTLVFADNPLPVWAALAPYVTSDGRNDDCFSFRNLSGPNKPLRHVHNGVSMPSQLEDHLAEVDSWLSAYPFDALTANRFSPRPATIYEAKYSAVKNKSWVNDQLVFCQLEPAARDTPPGIFQFAFGAWDSADYSGWSKSSDFKVHPTRWNELQGQDFSQRFEAAFGLIRYRDFLTYGMYEGPAYQTKNDWAGTMGLLPAIALLETENAIGPIRHDYFHPRDRYKYMPMQLHKPLTAYDSYNSGNTDVDEDRFSATAYWWFMLSHVLNKPSDRDVYLSALLSDRLHADETDLKTLMASMVDTVQPENSNGLRYYNAQFAAAYSNWPDTLFDNRVPQDVWLAESFGGCVEITVDENTVFERRTVSLPLDAAKCLEIEVRANRASFSAAYHIKLTGPSNLIDETTVAWSKIKDDMLCRDEDVATSKCILHSVPVLLEGGMADRYLTNESQDLTAGQAVEARYILSRTNESSTATANQNDLEITVSLEMTRVDSPLKVADGWSTVYAGKQGDAPVGPFGDSESTSPEDAIFNRSMGTSSAILDLAAQGGEIAIGMTNQAGDGLTFIPDDHAVLKSLATGTFPASASMTLAEGEIRTIQDPDRPSQLIITQHNDYALTFEGKANLCFIRESDENDRYKRMISEGMQAGMIKDLEARERAFEEIEEDLELDDICGGAFLRDTVQVKGSVPFPKTWTKDGRLKTWLTENYLKLRDLRADRIRDALYGGGLTSQPSSGAPGPNDPGNAPQPQRSSSGNGPNVSGGGVCTRPIYTNEAGCQCTCDAKSCLSQKIDSGTATGSEKSCRLFCGATWKSC